MRYWIILLALFVSSPLVALAGDRPNIIVILADDLGYSDLGCYGGEISTPNIDALASTGARFTQLYNSARCCPSRASLMTGLYPSQAGIGDFTTGKPDPNRGPGYLGRLSDQCVTMAEALKQSGYGCYYVGKWHMHPQTGPIKRGFDEFYGFTRDHSHDQYDADYYIRLPEGRKKEIDVPREDFYATDVFNDYAIEFIKQGQQTDKPWFLFLGHSAPHFPVQAPAERADKYDATYRRGWDVLREERYSRMKEIGLVNGDHWSFTPRSIVPVDRDDIANGFSGKQNPAWDTVDHDRQLDLARRMAVFAAMVETVDGGVGRIVKHLESTGDLDNTFIIFLSDNGACYEWGPYGFDGMSRTGNTILHTGDDLQKIGGHGTHHSYGSAWANLGNTPFQMYKHFTNEGGISTPCIAHWPKGIGEPDKWIRTPAHVMDVMPTLLDVAGATYPKTLDGHDVLPMEGTSLLPAMRGEEMAERTIGFDHQGAHALRQGDWKLVWSKRMPHKIEWELYNLAEDRCETHDLAKELPDRVAAMAADWDKWARHVQVIYEKPVTKLGKQQPKQRKQATPVASSVPASPPVEFGSIKKPLFADPNYNGSCDPEVVWNPATKEWWIFYTARRATLEKASYVGTPIGAISSPDLANWTFRGYLSFDSQKGQPDMPTTFWAPGIINDGKQFHMFVTYKDDVTPPWGGKGVIRHYVAPADDLLDGWKLVGTPDFAQPDPIDASLVEVDGEFRAYYRVGQGGGIQWATSADLLQWLNQGKCQGDVNAPAKKRGFGYQEAPYVFHWQDQYWMLTDPHEGLAVYSSPDGTNWTLQQTILEEPGIGHQDGTRARHPSVAVLGDRAFIFYHTEPNRPYPTPPAEKRTPHQKLSYLQMAELKIDQGHLTCDRNASIDLEQLESTVSTTFLPTPTR